MTNSPEKRRSSDLFVVRAVHRVLGALVRMSVVRWSMLVLARALPLASLRKELIRLRVFPEAVEASLQGVGAPGTRMTMVVGSPWDQVAARLWWDSVSGYEAPMPRLLTALAARADRAIVVGANTGFYCLLFALGAKVSRVDAVEPWPPAVHRLRKNVALNDLDRQIVVWPVAAAPTDGTTLLYVPPPLQEDWPFEMSASLSPVHRRRHGEQIEVETKTLESIRAASPQPVGVVLVDAEGYDVSVLQGAGSSLLRDRPLFFTEVTSDEVSALEDLRAEWGFVSVEIRPTEAVITPRVVRPSHTLGRVPDSEGDTEYWISGLIPPERVTELEAVAAACALTVTRDEGLELHDGAKG